MDPITSKLLTSVASGLTGKLLNAAGSRIAKSFFGPKEKEALQFAVRDGIVALLLTIPTDTEDERNLLDDIFQQFFQDEDTAKALVGLLRSMPPDLEDLQEIFRDLGFVAEQIAGFDFLEAMQAFPPPSWNRRRTQKSCSRLSDKLGTSPICPIMVEICL